MTQPIPPIGAAAIDAPASPRNPDTHSRQDPATEKVSQIAKIAINPLQDPSPQPIERSPSEEDQEQALIQNVMEQARQDGHRIAQTITEFGIKDPAALIEIAKLCAEQDGGKTAKYIKNFDIKDRDALIDIARLCAQQNGWATAQFIQKFDIKDRDDALTDIARLCAQQSAGTAIHIQNFGITDPTILIEIARLCAQQNYGRTAFHIKNFDIKDQDTLLDIARLCAKQDGGATAASIANFGITNEAARIEIAKLCSQKNGRYTTYYIKNFDITDQPALIDIARLCAKQDGEGTATYIQNFPITDPYILIDIARLCAIQDGVSVLAALRILKLTANTEQLKNSCYFQILASNTNDDLLTKFLYTDVLPALSPKISDLPGKLQEMLYKNRADLTPKDKFQLILFHISERAYFYQTGQEMTSEMKECLLPIIEYGNPPLATFLARTFAEDLDNTEGSTKMANYISYCKCTERPQRLQLPVLIACSLTDSEEQLMPIVRFITTGKIKNSFKNYKTGHTQSWLSTAMTLSQSSLSSGRKLALLSQTCVDNSSLLDPIDHKRRLAMINALCVLQKESLLDRDFTDRMTDELSDLLTTAVQTDDYIDLEGIGDFANRYTDTWGSTRVPAAWLTYEKGLRTLRDPRVQNIFQTMIRSVLDRSYSQERYNTQKSPHLAKIQESHGELFRSWQESRRAQLVVDSQEQVEQAFSFRDFLNEKRHYTHFTGAEQHFEQLFAWLDSRLEAAEYSPITKLCVSLCGQITLLKDKIPQLQQLQQELRMISQRTQFHQDIDDLLKQASQGAGNHNLEIVNTDDWQDLFLSGTEVLCSCQRIDGTPELNRCLMAYVMDGKNRMIAIKEKESEKIVARMIFRLLLDERNNPVLFLDRLYPENSPAHQKAMIEFAKEEAKRLGLPLVTEGDGGKPFDGTIRSLGSRAPYEYSDAAKGIQPDGVFTISGLICLN